MDNYTRRELLRCGPLTLATLWPILPLIAQGSRNETGAQTLNWDSFLENVHRAASRLNMSALQSQHQYVQTVSRLAESVRLPAALIMPRALTYANGSQYPDFLDVHETTSVEIKLLRFCPGDSIAAHNHPRMTGVSMCISGAVQIDTFEPEGAVSGSSFLVKRTETARVTERATSSLTCDRGNIHLLQAQQSCDLLDVFTPPYDEVRIRETQWYSLHPSDLAREHPTYVAHSLKAR